jgi:outer membrane lipoprotein-sorting protein
MFRTMRRLLFIGAFLAAAAAQAQLGHEIAQKHAERAGDKLAALTALRAQGRTFINGEVVPFLFIAQRPAKLRVESFTPLRRVIQVYDGAGQPWISHSEVRGAKALDMSEVEAKDFIANADFDGPLVDFAEKGYSVDYAGEEQIEGRKAFKLLLMNKRDSIFFLWVDAETYEIVKRTVYRVFNNQRIAMDTYFKDFREVGGVLQPHRIETVANGRTLYVMLIDKLEANPVDIPADTFTRPVPQANQP